MAPFFPRRLVFLSGPPAPAGTLRRHGHTGMHQGCAPSGPAVTVRGPGEGAAVVHGRLPVAREVRLRGQVVADGGGARASPGGPGRQARPHLHLLQQSECSSSSSGSVLC